MKIVFQVDHPDSEVQEDLLQTLQQVRRHFAGRGDCVGREDCVGIAFKDSDGFWKVSQISKEGDLLPQDGGWDKVGEYPCWRIPPKCVKSRKKKT